MPSNLPTGASKPFHGSSAPRSPIALPGRSVRASLPGAETPAWSTAESVPNHPRDITWAWTAGWCAAQVALAGVTVVTLSLLSSSPRRSHSVPRNVRHEEKTPSSFKVDELITEASHKRAFRALLQTLPATGEVAGGSVPYAETWMRDAADLHRSLQVCQRVLRESLEAATNSTALHSLRLPERPVLYPSEVMQRFAEIIKSAALDPRYDRFLNYPMQDRYEPYGGLHERWPLLALGVIQAELKEIHSLNAALDDAGAKPSWLARWR